MKKVLSDIKFKSNADTFRCLKSFVYLYFSLCLLVEPVEGGYQKEEIDYSFIRGKSSRGHDYANRKSNREEKGCGWPFDPKIQQSTPGRSHRFKSLVLRIDHIPQQNAVYKIVPLF